MQFNRYMPYFARQWGAKEGASDSIRPTRSPVGFEGFHGYVTKMGSRLSDEFPGLYEQGYGLPYESFMEYANYLHQLLWKGVGGWGEAVLGVYDPKHKAFAMFSDTFENLISSINEAGIARSYRLMTEEEVLPTPG